MYDALLSGQELNVTQCCQKFNISVSTFYRYINTVRAFVWEKDLTEVYYDPKTLTYKLVQPASKEA